MAEKVGGRQIADNFNYFGKKFLDSRDYFDTIKEMKEFDGNYVPEGFVTYCVENEKSYQYKEANVDDKILGKWREVNLHGYYSSMEKIRDYVYEANYIWLNYDYAYARFTSDGPTQITGLCSAVKKGNLIGRNYDWLYDESAEFIVHTPHLAGRYATVAVCTTPTKLTEEFMQSKKIVDDFVLMPFRVLDGINENGVYVSVNVVPNQKGDNAVILPLEEEKETISSDMLGRYIIDNFKSASAAVQFIKNHLKIYQAQRLAQLGYEPHYIIADGTNSYILEFAYGAVSIIDTTKDSDSEFADKCYMTNFHLTDTILNSDGTVYTPETKTDTEDAVTTNNIETLGAGLERYNLIVDNFEDITDKAKMQELMSKLKFTNTYKDETEPFWYSEYVGGELQVDSSVDDFLNNGIIEAAKQIFNQRSRNPESENFGTWQTVHSSVYDIEEKKLYIKFQEEDDEYEFEVDVQSSEKKERAFIKVEKFPEVSDFESLMFYYLTKDITRETKQDEAGQISDKYVFKAAPQLPDEAVECTVTFTSKENNYSKMSIGPTGIMFGEEAVYSEVTEEGSEEKSWKWLAEEYKTVDFGKDVQTVENIDSIKTEMEKIIETVVDYEKGIYYGDLISDKIVWNKLGGGNEGIIKRLDAKMTTKLSDLENGVWALYVSDEYKGILTKNEFEMSLITEKDFLQEKLTEHSVTGIKAIPSKVFYKYGEKIDPKTITVKAYYDDYEQGVLEDEDFTISSEYNETVPGIYEVVVKYGSLTDKYNVKVANRVLTKFEIDTSSVKKTYKPYEDFDPTNLKAYATFEDAPDAREEVYDYEIDISGFDNTHPGEHEIVVNYTYDVADLLISGYKTTFAATDDFALGDDFKAQIKKEDGEIVDVETSKCVVDSTAFVKGTAGEYTIYVTYAGKKKSYKVTVNA